MSDPALSIIVVSFNTRDLTLACLRSVCAQTNRDLFELLVVDNASADDSADAIAREFPDARLIRLDENVGFARANNLAAEDARGRRLLLLNSDTVVLDRAIEKLVEFADQHPDNLIYGGRTLFEDHTLNPSSCWARSTPFSEFCHAIGLTAAFRTSSLFNREAFGNWPRDTVRQVDIVSGCFFLIERELWRRLDGFAPEFFMYGEEADLCLRARRLGARPIVCPDARIIHYGGKSERSQAGKLVKLLKSRRLLIERHWPRRWVGFGRFMQKLGVRQRLLMYRLAAKLGRRSARERAETYAEVWRRRSEWSARRRQQTPKPRKRILAIASGGGHWEQLLRLRPAFEEHDLAFVTVSRAYAADVAGRRFHAVVDATRWNKLKLIRMAFQLLWIILRERPDVIVSTGAAPGYIGLRLGKLLGARTIWIDSIANVEELSMSGGRIGKHADLWLTQWPHLARPEGPQCAGSVL